jgi:hypothetical protein
MKTRTNITDPAAGNQLTRARRLPGVHPGWGIRRIRRSWCSPLLLPSIEEAERRMRSRPGFIASLTPEQIAMLTTYDGPEIWGDPNGPKRTY